MLQDGSALSIPAILELEGAKKGWTQIIESLGGAPDSFVTDVAQVWLPLIQRQGGTITVNFADQLLALLDGQPKPADVLPPGKEKGAAPPKEEAAKPAAGASAVPVPEPPAEVSSKISDHYYGVKTLRESKPSSQAALQADIQKALDTQDAIAFLMAHLSFVRHGKMPQVPKSTVVAVIRSQWESILMDRFSWMPEDQFLDDLSKLWFYLVHQDGFPARAEVIENQLYRLTKEQKTLAAQLLARLKTPAGSSPQVKQSWLQKIRQRMKF